MPLQQANSELSEKSGMLQAEKKILEEEIKRWKARTQVGRCCSYGVEKQGRLFMPHVLSFFFLIILAFGEPAKGF